MGEEKIKLGQAEETLLNIQKQLGRNAWNMKHGPSGTCKRYSPEYVDELVNAREKAHDDVKRLQTAYNKMEKQAKKSISKLEKLMNKKNKAAKGNLDGILGSKSDMQKRSI